MALVDGVGVHRGAPSPVVGLTENRSRRCSSAVATRITWAIGLREAERFGLRLQDNISRAGAEAIAREVKHLRVRMALHPRTAEKNQPCWVLQHNEMVST